MQSEATSAVNLLTATPTVVANCNSRWIISLCWQHRVSAVLLAAVPNQPVQGKFHLAVPAPPLVPTVQQVEQTGRGGTIEIEPRGEKRRLRAEALGLADGHAGMHTLGQGLGRAIQHLGGAGQMVRSGDHHRLPCQPRPLTALDGDRQMGDDEISDPAHVAWELSATRTPSSIMRTVAWPPGSLQRLCSTVAYVS